MADATNRRQWSLGLGLILTTLLLGLAFVSARLLQRARLRQAPLAILGQIHGFSLTNQAGQPVTLTNLLGRVWIADVIFTRCQSSCENLTRRLAALQGRLPAPDRVQLVSLTADPEYDTPAVLTKYGQNHAARPERWQFLTGSKKEIYRLAIEDLKFTVVDKTQEPREPLEEMFLHSTLLVLVDRQGRVRGYFPGTEPSGADQTLAGAQRLLREK
jgi:protein SCO1/2